MSERGAAPNRLPRVIAPTLLVVVALVQIAQTRMADQTPWIGGGIGMFAATENTASRVLQITLETPSGPVAVAPPGGASVAAQLAAQARPTEGNLRELGRVILGLRWVVLADPTKEHLENLAIAAEQKTAASSPPPRLGVRAVGGEPLKVEAVVVKLWQRRVDLPGKRVFLEAISEHRIGPGAAP